MMASHLLWIVSIAFAMALSAGISACLPRPQRSKSAPGQAGQSLPPEIWRAVEAGMATMPLFGQTPTDGNDDTYPTRHQTAAAINAVTAMQNSST